MKVTIPIRTVSEANRASSEHWRVRHRRAKSQRAAACLATRAPALAMYRLRLVSKRAIVVTITRIAPGTLDSDNLPTSQKHIRDGVADALGINDRSPLIAWLYLQRKGKPNQYAVEIEIAALESEQVEAAP